MSSASKIILSTFVMTLVQLTQPLNPAVFAQQPAQVTHEIQVVQENTTTKKSLRREKRKLAKLVAEIQFVGGTDIFDSDYDADRILDQVAAFMKKHPELSVELIGVTRSGLVTEHTIGLTHEVGNEAYRDQQYGTGPSGSRALALARAEKTRNELIKRGANPDQIQTKGAYPGFRKKWYSYLLSVGGYALVPLAGPGAVLILTIPLALRLDQGVEADKRVIIRFR